MAIDSVIRNTATNTTRQPVETRLTEELKQAERQEAKQQEISRRKAEEAMQPFVNAQGLTSR